MVRHGVVWSGQGGLARCHALECTTRLVALTCTHLHLHVEPVLRDYVHVHVSGDEDERIGYAFAVYDTSGDHQIDLEELTKMLMHVNGWDTNVAVTQASHIMDMFDVDDGTAGGVKDKKLSLDEFKRLVGEGKDMKGLCSWCGNLSR